MKLCSNIKNSLLNFDREGLNKFTRDKYKDVDSKKVENNIKRAIRQFDR